MKRAMVFLVLGPVIGTLVAVYAFGTNMPIWQLLLLGLIPSVSGFYTDRRQIRAGFTLNRRAMSCGISGAVGGLVMATLPKIFGLSTSGFAYSMIFAGGIIGIICCLLAAQLSEVSAAMKRVAGEQ
jgi:hypothetical protein